MDFSITITSPAYYSMYSYRLFVVRVTDFRDESNLILFTKTMNQTFTFKLVRQMLWTQRCDLCPNKQRLVSFSAAAIEDNKAAFHSLSSFIRSFPALPHAHRFRVYRQLNVGYRYSVSFIRFVTDVVGSWTTLNAIHYIHRSVIKSSPLHSTFELVRSIKPASGHVYLWCFGKFYRFPPKIGAWGLLEILNTNLNRVTQN